MARPLKPLISRNAALKVALDMIETEGLETFSLPQLAARIGVRAPSLYHHFRDRDDLLLAVVRRIAASAVPSTGRSPGRGWREHLIALAVNFRQAAQRYPNATPLLLYYRPRDLLPGGYEAAARFLRESGVPIVFHVRILDGLETLMIGTVLSESINPFLQNGVGFRAMDSRTEPILAAALEACTLDADALFEAKVRAFLDGVARDGNPRAPHPSDGNEW